MQTTETELWAASRGMALTRRRDGRPQLGSGSPASALKAALDRLSDLGVADAPGVHVLGERAALGGLTRNAPRSVGGAFRILPAADAGSASHCHDRPTSRWCPPWSSTKRTTHGPLPRG